MSDQPMGGPIQETVWIVPYGAERYHTPDRGYRGGGYYRDSTRCGMLTLSDLVEFGGGGELEAIEAGIFPCGRCWFRSWRRRTEDLKAILDKREES